MPIHVHIDRLILNGLPLDAADGPAVQAAVEAELTRLLSVDSLAMKQHQRGALGVVRDSDTSFTHNDTPGSYGTQIGQAVHRGISP